MADLFSILANPTRLKIIKYLIDECCKRKEGCCCVSEIYTELDLPQPLISKHLKILKNNDVLDYTRQGNRILYRFAEKNSLSVILDFLRRFEAKQKC